MTVYKKQWIYLRNMLLVSNKIISVSKIIRQIFRMITTTFKSQFLLFMETMTTQLMIEEDKV